MYWTRLLTIMRGDGVKMNRVVTSCAENVP